MDPTTNLADARLTRFLETEPVLWLSTVGPDGSPNLVPTWFVWDGMHITIVSKPGARKARNLAHDPRATVALGDAEDDFDVGLLRARANLLPTSTPPALPDGFLAKYASQITELELTPVQFAATYAQQIQLTPTRALGWHGRSTPSSVIDAAGVVALAGRASMMEPIRAALRPLFGEPIARLAPG